MSSRIGTITIVFIAIFLRLNELKAQDQNFASIRESMQTLFTAQLQSHYLEVRDDGGETDGALTRTYSRASSDLLTMTEQALNLLQSKRRIDPTIWFEITDKTRQERQLVLNSPTTRGIQIGVGLTVGAVEEDTFANTSGGCEPHWNKRTQQIIIDCQYGMTIDVAKILGSPAKELPTAEEVTAWIDAIFVHETLHLYLNREYLNVFLAMAGLSVPMVVEEGTDVEAVMAKLRTATDLVTAIHYNVSLNAWDEAFVQMEMARMLPWLGLCYQSSDNVVDVPRYHLTYQGIVRGAEKAIESFLELRHYNRGADFEERGSQLVADTLALAMRPVPETLVLEPLSAVVTARQSVYYDFSKMMIAESGFKL